VEEPEQKEGGRQPQVARVVSVRLQSGEGLAEVGVLLIQQRNPALLFNALQPGRPVFGKLQKVGCVALLCGFPFALSPELFERKLPDGLEHVVARCLSALVDPHQALVEQRAKAIEDVQLV